MYDLSWKNLAEYKKIPITPHEKDKVKNYFESIAPIFWEEHCVECAIPECYSVCPMYSRRADKNCARFSFGIVPNHKFNGAMGYGADIHFKKWAKLEAFWSHSPAMISINRNKLESRIINKLKLLFSSSRYANRLLKFFVKPFSWFIQTYTKVRIRLKNSQTPDFFYIKFYYPDFEIRSLQIEVKTLSRTTYRNVIQAQNGWNEFLINFDDLSAPTTSITRISISPLDTQPMRIIFSWLDLVKVKQHMKKTFLTEIQSKKIKCLCWDLDNTLWDGVIGEVGPENVTVNSNVKFLIEELDKRGILQSICSKNEFQIAWDHLVKLGLNKYFLYPQINWGPKSSSIKEISKKLNIGIDTIGFLDDSDRELYEVKTSLPLVEVFHANTKDKLLHLQQFMVAETSVSKSRREMYLDEQLRSSDFSRFDRTAEDFLRESCLVLKIGKLDKNEKISRCLELLQRTNQFNFSAQRYTKKDFEQFIVSSKHKIFCGDLSDRYGALGIIIFMSINISSNIPIIDEFAMSCRAAQKYVDLGLFQWASQHIGVGPKSQIQIKYKDTGKNKPLLDILKNLDTKPIDSGADYNIVEISNDSFSVNYLDIISIELDKNEKYPKI